MDVGTQQANNSRVVYRGPNQAKRIEIERLGAFLRFLITGVAGFIGSSIARRLIKDGHDVVGIDSLTDYYDNNIKESNLQSITSPRFQFIKGDINDLDLVALLGRVDIVFHEAGQPGVRKSWGNDFDIYVDENIRATQALLEAARSVTLKKFVYASSSSVYGESQEYPAQESQRCLPVSPYGVTKLAAENMCCLYAKNFAVPTVSLRYFTVYGPGQRPDMAFTRFLRAAVTGSEIQIFGKGDQIRDFTYIDDIVEANICVALGDTLPGEIFNVAGGSSVSVNEVLQTIESMTNTKLNVKYIEKVAGDVSRTGGSIDRITTAVNWSPKVTLPHGLALHYEWAKTTFGGSAIDAESDDAYIS